MDDGATWVPVAEQPVTVRAEDGTHSSELHFKKMATGQNGALVRAVFHNAHGTAVTDPVALTIAERKGKGNGRQG